MFDLYTIELSDHFEQEVEKLEYGLIALWEIIENQAVLAEGRENDLFTSLLRLRFCSKINVRTFQCISMHLLINYYHNRYWKQVTRSETPLCPGSSQFMGSRRSTPACVHSTQSLCHLA